MTARRPGRVPRGRRSSPAIRAASSLAGKPEGAVPHCLVEQGLHLADLLGRRALERVAHDAFARHCPGRRKRPRSSQRRRVRGHRSSRRACASSNVLPVERFSWRAACPGRARRICPSPSTSVVTPWRILLWASPSSSSTKSECECMSMKPGATTSPFGVDLALRPGVGDLCRRRRSGRRAWPGRRRTRGCRCRRRSGRCESPGRRPVPERLRGLLLQSRAAGPAKTSHTRRSEVQFCSWGRKLNTEGGRCGRQRLKRRRSFGGTARLVRSRTKDTRLLLSDGNRRCHRFCWAGRRYSAKPV